MKEHQIKADKVSGGTYLYSPRGHSEEINFAKANSELGNRKLQVPSSERVIKDQIKYGTQAFGFPIQEYCLVTGQGTYLVRGNSPILKSPELTTKQHALGQEIVVDADQTLHGTEHVLLDGYLSRILDCGPFSVGIINLPNVSADDITSFFAGKKAGAWKKAMLDQRILGITLKALFPSESTREDNKFQTINQAFVRPVYFSGWRDLKADKSGMDADAMIDCTRLLAQIEQKNQASEIRHLPYSGGDTLRAMNQVYGLPTPLFSRIFG